MKESIVNLAEVQKMIGNSLSLFKSLIGAFNIEGDAQLRAIEKSIFDKDSKSLDNSAHSFKSSLATLGAFTASGIAGELEALGKSGNMNGAPEIFTKLKLEYGLVSLYFDSNKWIKDWDSVNL